MIEQYTLYIISFSLFAVLQSLAINGVYYACQGSCVDDIHKGKICNGNIIYKLSPSFFEKHKGKTWTLPLWGCVRCQSSIIGGLIYWPVVIYLFDFKWIEVFVYGFDVCILASLNWYIFKKL